MLPDEVRWANRPTGQPAQSSPLDAATRRRDGAPRSWSCVRGTDRVCQQALPIEQKRFGGEGACGLGHATVGIFARMWPLLDKPKPSAEEARWGCRKVGRLGCRNGRSHSSHRNGNRRRRFEVTGSPEAQAHRCFRQCAGSGHRCSRQDSNLRTWLRRPMLYPLSYGSGGSELLRAKADCSRTVGVARIDSAGGRGPIRRRGAVVRAN